MYFADRGCVCTWRNLYRYATATRTLRFVVTSTERLWYAGSCETLISVLGVLSNDLTNPQQGINSWQIRTNSYEARTISCETLCRHYSRDGRVSLLYHNYVDAVVASASRCATSEFRKRSHCDEAYFYLSSINSQDKSVAYPSARVEAKPRPQTHFLHILEGHRTLLAEGKNHFQLSSAAWTTDPTIIFCRLTKQFLHILGHILTQNL